MKPTALPLIPENHWNRMAGELARKLGLIFGGRGGGKGYRLPWEIEAVWNPFYNQFEASVHAGFVNFQETETPVLPWDRAPGETRLRLADSGGQPVRAWLSERPWFPLPPANFRRIGYDADPARDPESVPEYFAALGVGAPPRLDIDIEGLSINVVQAAELTASRRLLRAIDIVLTIPKPAASVVATGSGPGAAIDVTLSTPTIAVLPSLFTSRFWSPPAEAFDIREQLAGGLTDPTFVERRVGTVYFISPPDAPLESVPDLTWTPVVRQDMTYNRVLATRTDLDQLPRLSLSLVTGLAGGLADPIFAGLLDPINEADAAASLALSRASVRVEEWTL